MPAIAIEQPSKTDMDTIHAMLRETYWSPGIPRETVERACANSMCAIARNDDGTLIGFARLVTDRATFAWLCDVVVAPAQQGQGIARALVRAFLERSELSGIRRWLLGTKDAHGVYEPLGFSRLDQPERMMHIRDFKPYGQATS